MGAPAPAHPGSRRSPWSPGWRALLGGGVLLVHGTLAQAATPPREEPPFQIQSIRVEPAYLGNPPRLGLRRIVMEGARLTLAEAPTPSAEPPPAAKGNGFPTHPPAPPFPLEQLLCLSCGLRLHHATGLWEGTGDISLRWDSSTFSAITLDALLDVRLPWGITLSGMALALEWQGSSLQVRHFSTGAWGGEISLDDARMDLASGRGEADILFRGLEAQPLLAPWFSQESFRMDARMSGAVGIRLEPSGWTIPPTQLAADGPGVIRLRHPGIRTWAQGAGIPEILPNVLEELYFQTLRLDLERTHQGEIRARARLAGHNPRLYDGHPVEVNLDLSGPLDEILQQVLEMRKLLSDR